MPNTQPRGRQRSVVGLKSNSMALTPKSLLRLVVLLVFFTVVFNFRSSNDLQSPDRVHDIEAEDEASTLNHRSHPSQTTTREEDVQKRQQEQHIQTEPKSNDDVLQESMPMVLEAARLARTRNEFGDYAVFQMLDKNFVSMTKHWICNVRKFQFVLDATVFLVLDREAESALREMEGNLNVVYLPYISTKRAELAYGQVAYYELMSFRSNLLLNVLKNNVDFMLVESDAFWGKNALQEIANLEWPAESYDMISASDHITPDSSLQGGFQLNRASSNSKFMWGLLTSKMKSRIARIIARHGSGSSDNVNEQGSEQLMMDDLIQKKGPNIGYKLRYLPREIVASGQWYSDPKWAVQYPDPAVVLNNWMVGNGNKVERAKKIGHFCYDESADMCDYAGTKFEGVNIVADDESTSAGEQEEEQGEEQVKIEFNKVAKPTSNDDVLKQYMPVVLEAARLARTRNKYGDYAVFQMLDKNFVSMTKHWICNVRKFTGVLDAAVFLVLDREAESALRTMDGSLNVVYLPYISAKQAELEYGQVAYYELMSFRSHLLVSLLNNDMDFMLLESDAFWGKNALQEIANLQWPTESYDMISASDHITPDSSLQGGFQLNRASENSKMMWGILTKNMKTRIARIISQHGSGSSQNVNEQGSEQIMMDGLIQTKGPEVGYKLRYLPREIVASGQWYSDPKWADQYPNPAVILNNWVVGNGNKVERAKKLGHFCYNADTNKCDYTGTKFEWNNTPTQGLRGGAVSSVANTNKDVFQATIVILTMARAHSLERLLKSIKAADYDAGPGKSNDIRFVIRIDKPNQEKYAEGYARVLSMADAFQHDAFLGGVSVDIQTTNKGLKNQWFTSFQNPRSDREVGIFLEDDLEVSPQYFKWLRIQWENHGDNPYVGSVSLQRQTLRAALPPNYNSPIVNNHRPFLYRLIGTWGLSARADLWLDFTKSYIDRTDVDIPGLITTKWYRDPVAGKSMWSQHFIHYLWKKDKFTLFVNLPNGKTMCSNWQEPGEHYHGKPKVDFPALQVWNEEVMTAYDAELKRHDFNTELILD